MGGPDKLGVSHDRIAKRLGVTQQMISSYLLKMPQLVKWVNSDLLKGFTVPQVAQKYGWPVQGEGSNLYSLITIVEIMVCGFPTTTGKLWQRRELQEGKRTYLDY